MIMIEIEEANLGKIVFRGALQHLERMTAIELILLVFDGIPPLSEDSRIKIYVWEETSKLRIPNFLATFTEVVKDG